MSPTSHPHILIVDDDPTIREALASALGDSYVVHSVASGAQAFVMLQKQPVSVIILDAILGADHGFDLIDRFRAMSLAPILVLTGHGSEELAVRALRARVDEYLKKPVSLLTLRAALDRLVPRLQRSAEVAARALKYLEAHSSKPLRASALAGQLGVGEAHLRRIFRSAYGKTPRRYLTEVRMRRAGELLWTTSLGIKQIAGEVGYSSVAMFDRVFRGFHGVTPSEYRADSIRTANREGLPRQTSGGGNERGIS
jgi:YesN/AraC family two-component response regulator